MKGTFPGVALFAALALCIACFYSVHKWEKVVSSGYLWFLNPGIGANEQFSWQSCHQYGCEGSLGDPRQGARRACACLQWSHCIDGQCR
ncbi:hypothetical protein MARINON1_40125 [Marinobacter salarius]|nr:hypothetical protein MBHK15_111257 [Marinobacter salarius]VXB18366.1 hypothetical protein MARINON1_40125 [Marinobacter salarius]